MTIAKIPMDEVIFRRMHAADRMANDKLVEGIHGFCKALEALEAMLVQRIRVARGEVKLDQVTRDFFGVYDLDGDGFITREEWAGQATVFAALDTNGDGKVSFDELAAGLGAAHRVAGERSRS